MKTKPNDPRAMQELKLFPILRFMLFVRVNTYEVCILRSTRIYLRLGPLESRLRGQEIFRRLTHHVHLLQLLADVVQRLVQPGFLLLDGLHLRLDVGGRLLVQALDALFSRK